MRFADDPQTKSDQKLAAEVDDEIRFHLSMVTEELMAQGWQRELAEEEALRRFGPKQRHAGECRRIQRRRRRTETRRAWWTGLGLDLRVAARGLRSSPWMTSTAVLTLGLAMGAAVLVFSLVDGLLLRSLPIPRPGDVMLLWERSPEGVSEYVSPANFVDWRERATSFAALAAFEDSTATLTGLDEPINVQLAEVADGFFTALGAEPRLGRFFDTDDYEEYRPLAVVSDRFFESRLGGLGAAIGSTLRLDGIVVTVVGVLRDDVALPHGTDVWVPLHFDFDVAGSRGAQYLTVLARQHATLERAEVQAELEVISASLAEQYPDDNRDRGIQIEPLRDALTRDSQRPLLALLAAVTLVLVLGVLDTASLILARGLNRQGEFAVRAALGSGRTRIARLLLLEGWYLALAGTVVGVTLAVAGLRLMKSTLPYRLPRLDHVAIDGRILAFAVIAAIVAGSGAGALTAARMARARVDTRGASRDHRTRRLHTALVVGQLALAVVLAIGAGLLVRSFVEMSGVDGGFRREQLLTFRVELPDGTYGDDRARELAFFDQLEERLAALPGVVSVGLVPWLPLDSGWFFSYYVAGEPRNTSGRDPSASFRPVSAGYHETLGISLLRGRTFTAADRGSSQPVVMINESLARRAFGDTDPVGRQLVVGYGNPDSGDIERTIVGVVADVLQLGLGASPVPSIYVPNAQIPFDVMSVAILSGGDPLDLAPQVREIVHQLDDDLVVERLATMEQRVATHLGPQRFVAWLMMTFAALALLIALVGIYGMLARLVTARRQELGVRLALGANPRHLVLAVLRHGTLLALVGALLGVLLSLVLSRGLESMLFGVSRLDPAVFVVAPLLLLITTLFASLAPAMRAVRVDAAETVRAE